MSEILSFIGYHFAALLVVTLPGALLYWFLIHTFAEVWRRLGKTPTFIIVGGICLGLAVVLWTQRDQFMAVHWGYHWPLMALGLVLYAVGAYRDRLIRKQLVFKILVGTPELDAEAPGELITHGVFGRSRNPRYLNLMSPMLGFALMLNYPALYVVVALCVPGLYFVVLLEERELRGRFGEQYEDYCRRVPRFLPRHLKSGDQGSSD
jgi:protein-S-isoprenylcysteine O-methyltransferase Ste14